MAIDGFKMTNGLCSGDQKTTGPGKNCSTINFFQLICINFTLRWLRRSDKLSILKDHLMLSDEQSFRFHSFFYNKSSTKINDAYGQLI